MSQLRHTKHRGDITLDVSWHTREGLCIGRTPSGAYIHTSGLSVTRADDLRACIDDPDELQRALNWFEHRDSPAALAVEEVRTVYYDRRGDCYRYVDSHQAVVTKEDLMAALVEPALTHALQWHMRQVQQPDQQPQTPEERILQVLAEGDGKTQAQLQKLTGYQSRVVIEVLQALVDLRQIAFLPNQAGPRRYFLRSQLEDLIGGEGDEEEA